MNKKIPTPRFTIAIKLVKQVDQGWLGMLSYKNQYFLFIIISYSV